MCGEGYVDKSKITPVLNLLECLENHTQYVCRYLIILQRLKH